MLVSFVVALNPTSNYHQVVGLERLSIFLSDKGFARRRARVNKTRWSGVLGVVCWASLPASDAPESSNGFADGHPRIFRNPVKKR